MCMDGECVNPSQLFIYYHQATWDIIISGTSEADADADAALELEKMFTRA